MRNAKLIIIVTVTLLTVIWMALDAAYFAPTSPKNAAPDAAQHFTPKPAPEVTFTKLDGGSIALHSLKGNTVLLNFWASWCAPCREEFPILLQRVSADETTVLLAVTADANVTDAENFLAPLQKKFAKTFATGRVIIAHDPMGKMSTREFQTYHYPETILIAPDGMMRKKIVGVVTEENLN